MGYSRIALAMLLALGALSPAHGATQPFMVEIKGPDEPAAATTTTPPVAPTVTETPAARAADPARGTVRTERYGPIRRTDTLWSLASAYRPSSRVSVYQTMVAIYNKNPQSFADGNINHILVGSTISLPSEQEASRIPEAEARARFRSDNVSWKGISPRYHVAQPSGEVRNLTVKPKKEPAKPVADVKPAPEKPAEKSAAPLPQAPVTAESAKPDVAAPAPISAATATDTKPEPVAAAAPEPIKPEASKPDATKVEESAAPKPLPAQTQTEQTGSATEMKLALEDATTQLAQVSETNHRLKLRVESMNQELETLKAQLVDQTTLQKEIEELKAKQGAAPVAAVPEAPSGKSWIMDLLSSPLNLAMIILLPVLLVLAIVTLWLRARARRELEEQEKSLSESTAAFMDDDSNELDHLLAGDMPVMMTEPQGEALPQSDTLSPVTALDEPDAHDLVFSDEGEHPLTEEEPISSPAASRDPELVPEPDAIPTLNESLFATAVEDEALPFNGQDELKFDEEQYEEFDLSELDAELDKILDEEDAVEPVLSASADTAEDPVINFDPALLAGDVELDAADPLADEQALSAETVPHRDAAENNQFVEIDALLAEADVGDAQEPSYQSANLDVGLDEFPDVMPESTGFDVDSDDGGVGAKLDLARAYLEIDDMDSARELLEEAAAQGSESQRAEAQKLLKRLA